VNDLIVIPCLSLLRVISWIAVNERFKTFEARSVGMQPTQILATQLEL